MKQPFFTLALTVFVCGALLGCRGIPLPAANSPAAERVFLHGVIYTADAHQRTVSAMAVSGDRILFVGDDEAAASWVGRNTIVTDLQGRRVLPGLHDAHVHPVETIRIDRCNLESEPVDLAELADFTSACLARLAVSPGRWLVVKNWNFYDGNTPAEGLPTLRAALDRASRNTPILLETSDSHHFATNSAGLALARNKAGEPVGLNAATLARDFRDLAPYIGLDTAGEPNGEVHEKVYQKLGVSRAVLLNIDALVPEAGQIPAWFNSHGITSLFEAAFYPELAPVYDSLAQQGALSLRVTLAQYYELDDYKTADGTVDMDAIMAQARATREKYTAVANIKADQLKYFVDGVLEGNPLANPPGLPNAAQLRDYYQPIFTLDAKTGQPLLAGYADPDSAACKALPEPPGGQLNQREVNNFFARNGFYPAQCLRSSGVMFQPVDTTRRFIDAAVASDFGVHFHAIGDRAVRVATDAIAAVTVGRPSTNQHSIAHAQLVHPDDVARIAALRIPVVFTYDWAVRDYDYDVMVMPFVEHLKSLQDMYDPASYYMQQAYPARSIRDSGGVLAAGSDAPVGTDDPVPFLNIEMAVSRDDGEGPLNADEDIGILDAIDAYTINGARMMQQADITGSLEIGKKADFIVLDRDIIALANAGHADEVSETRVLETWFDGALVYRRTP